MCVRIRSTYGLITSVINIYTPRAKTRKVAAARVPAENKPRRKRVYIYN